MELWIRSQDKEDLIIVDNIGLAYKGKYYFVDNDTIDDKFYICQFTNDFHTKLGSYKTKERALEVLEDIQKTLFVKNMYEQDRELLLKVWNNFDQEEIEFLRKKITVYEMPEK